MSRNDYSAYSMVVGRFQPFHNGHMDVIRKCASESDHLIVGIGSAQYSHHPDNPFTAGERYLMIENSLDDAGIHNYSIVPMEDLNRYSVWVSHVVSMSPPFRRVYTNNPLTKRLFEEAGFEVRASPLYNRDVYSGTEIRRRIVAEEEWRSLVPKAVSEVMDDIDGVGRLRDISGGGDNAPLRSRGPGKPSRKHGKDSVNCRILHRRSYRRRSDGHPRLFRGLYGRYSFLFKRSQDGSSRR